jgi:hypothetical protein
MSRRYVKQLHDKGFSSIWYEENGYRISFTDQDPANTDYQAYLGWVAEGNTAEEWTGE